MGVAEYFRGTDQDKTAIANAEELDAELKSGERKRLSARQNAPYEFGMKLRAQFRRRVVTALGAALAAALGIGYAAVSGGSDNESEPSAAEVIKFDPETKDTLENKLMAEYDAAFDELMTLIPDTMDPKATDVTNHLVRLKEFKQKYVKWAALKGDTFFALEQGFSNGGWMAIIPSSHPFSAQLSNTYSVEYRFGMRVLRILPHLVSDEMKGVFILHETSHLFDQVFGVESKNPSSDEYLTGELRAYGVEIAALNRKTNGAFSKSINDMLLKYGVKSVSEIISLYKRGGLNGISAQIGLGPVLSREETGLRHGLFAVAMVMSMVEKEQGLSNEDKMKKFINGLRDLFASQGGHKH